MFDSFSYLSVGGSIPSKAWSVFIKTSLLIVTLLANCLFVYFTEGGLMKDLQNNLHLGAFIMLGLVAFTAGVLNSIVAEVALKVYYFYQTSIYRKPGENLFSPGFLLRTVCHSYWRVAMISRALATRFSFSSFNWLSFA